MKKPASVIIVFLITIGILVGVRSVVASRISTSGVELSQIQEETSKYVTQNAILEEKIFSLSSLTHVSETASKNGFVDSKEAFAVSGAKPIARGQ